MYGSSLRMETERPRALRIRPMLAAVIPFPSEEVTPPVTKTYFDIGRAPPGVFRMLPKTVPAVESKRSPRAKAGGTLMQFDELVLRRRTVRRFEDAPVDRAVLEKIARLAQRTPSAGFAQG